jgi:hypothetical protein
VVDPDAALAEMARVLAPHGRLLLQVPLLSGTTEALPAPENAAPGTARWAFGLDLVGRVAALGLDARVLITDELADLAEDPGSWGSAATSGEVDLAGLLGALAHTPTTPVADRPLARRCGWTPAVLFTTIEATRAR